MAAEVGGYLADKVAERLIPKGIEWGLSFVYGKSMVILGPARAGKTSFLKYLEADHLEPEKITAPTTKVRKGRSVVLLLGKDRKLKVRMWKPRDVPGDVPAENQVLYVQRYKPDSMAIVLDASKFFLEPGKEAQSSLEWLRTFCRYLDLMFKRHRKLAGQLASIVVVMNKWDKIPSKDAAEDQETRTRFELKVREIFDECMDNTFYRKGGARVEVIPCSLVRSKYKKALADDALNAVASSLRD